MWSEIEFVKDCIQGWLFLIKSWGIHYLPCSLTRHLLSMLQSFDNHYRSKYSHADTEREMARCSSVPTRLMCSTIVHLIAICAAVVRFPNPLQVSWGTWLIMRQFCVQCLCVPFLPCDENEQNALNGRTDTSRNAVEWSSLILNDFNSRAVQF